VTLADGRRAFVKACGVELNPDTPGMHRREARYAAQMPEHAPVPKLLGTFDEDGWVVLVYEEIAGHNPDPSWDPDELRRTVDALAEMSELLTPSPIEAPPVVERLAGFDGWRCFARARAEAEEKGEGKGKTEAEGVGALAGLDPWAVARLERLVALEELVTESCAGDTLLNMDVRADNILITADRVYVVDWPWASRGAPWLDLAMFVPSVWLHGGRERARVVTEHPLLAALDPDTLTPFVAAVTGMCLWGGSQPAPPGLPTLRPFQRAMGAAALEWLRDFVA